MMGQSTNYADIQQDEIQALQSIYMDDLYEEGIKTGAWNVSEDLFCRHSTIGEYIQRLFWG